MTFKRQNKLFVLVFIFLFSSHCGLRIGEKAPPIPKYKLFPSAGYCSTLDYKAEFRAYFFEKPAENPADDLSGERWRKALKCIGLEITRVENLIYHEYFEKQELINLLNQNFVKRGNMEPIVNNIVNPSNFDDYIFIKDAIVHLIKERPDNTFIQADQICQKQWVNDIVFSKQEVDIFVDFLENLSHFFIIVERSSYELFEQFFKSHSLSSRSQLEDSDDFKVAFVSFLSDYLNKEFPAYSRFLDEKLFGTPFDFDWLNNYLKAQRAKEILNPLLDTAQLPLPFSDDLTVQNIRYMMLNIYITRAFFSVYDVNQDSILSPEELKPLSCIIVTLVSIIISPRMKNQWSAIQTLYDPRAIANYIIRYQEIPLDWDMDYIQYRLLENFEELESLSYIEVSRLVFIFLEKLFGKVH